MALKFEVWLKADTSRISYLLLCDAIRSILREHPDWDNDHEQIAEFIEALDCVEETNLMKLALTDAVAFRACLSVLANKYDL